MSLRRMERFSPSVNPRSGVISRVRQVSSSRAFRPCAEASPTPALAVVAEELALTGYACLDRLGGLAFTAVIVSALAPHAISYAFTRPPSLPLCQEACMPLQSTQSPYSRRPSRSLPLLRLRSRQSHPRPRQSRLRLHPQSPPHRRQPPLRSPGLQYPRNVALSCYSVGTPSRRATETLCQRCSWGSAQRRAHETSRGILVEGIRHSF